MINSLLIPNSYPTRCVVEGPLAEIQAHVPQTEIGEGYVTTGETIFWHHGAWHTTGGGSSSPATAIAPAGFISANLYDGIETNPGNYVGDTGAVTSGAGFACSNFFSVTPGDLLFIFCGRPAFLFSMGCYFLNGVFVQAVVSTVSSTDGLYQVPAGCNQIRISLYQASNSDSAPPFIYRVNLSLPGLRKFTNLASIGDSIAHGAFSTVNYGGLVAAKLGIAGGAFTNLGIDSSTIAASAHTPIYARMNTISANADVVLFEGGGNDAITYPITLGTVTDTVNTTFYGALNICAAYLKTHFPFATICWVAVPRWYLWKGPNSFSLSMDDYMNAFKAVAAINGFKVADCYNKMSGYAFPAQDIFMNPADQKHPNTIGHYMMADIIANAILNQ